jgi:hypothetical protein
LHDSNFFGQVFAKPSSLYFESNLNHVGSKDLQDKKEVLKLGSRKYISLIPGMLLEGTQTYVYGPGYSESVVFTMDFH